MKRSALKKNTKPKGFVSRVEEPETLYRPVKAQPSLKVKDFTYADFKKLADKIPFTQAEWAAMLHVSERTLQRYAKTNAAFAPINTQRALQLAKVIRRGTEVLGKAENFYHWIKRNPNTLEGPLSFEALTSADGLDRILTQLGRIEHGLFA